MPRADSDQCGLCGKAMPDDAEALADDGIEISRTPGDRVQKVDFAPEAGQ